MAKQYKKSKSPKLKKSNASEGSLKTKKQKTTKSRGSVVSKHSNKTRFSNDLKDSKKNYEIRNSIVNDDLWNCTIVIIAFPTTHGGLPQLLEELPNTAVISSKMLDQTIMKTNKSPRSGASSGTKATKTARKMSNKTKKLKNRASKTIQNIEDEKGNFKMHFEEEKLNLTNTCTLIKQWIVNLRNFDLRLDKSTEKSEKQKAKSKEINKKQGLTVGKDIFSSSEESHLKISHRYIVLSGFYSLVLPEIMKSMLIPVKALITIKVLNLPHRESNPNNKTKIKSHFRPKHKSLSIEKTDEYSLFLNNLTKCKHDLKYLEQNNDLLFLNYNITDLEADEITINWKENMNKVLNLIRHSWNEFEYFKVSQNIIEIPSDEVLNIEDAILYNTMISMVPMECVSIPIIISCMLDQVIHWVDNEEGPSVTSSEHISVSSENSVNINKYSCNSFNTYHHITQHKPIINVSPILINAADDSKYKTFHLKLPELDFDIINSSFSFSSLVYRLWDLFPKLTPSKIKWNQFHLNLLKKFFPGYINNDNLYTIHFHHFLMIFFLSKLEKIFSESENTAETDLNSLSTQGKYFYLQPVEDKYSNYFVGRIVGNIIQQVPKLSIQLKEMLPSICESMGLSCNHEDGDGDQLYAVKESKLLKKLLHKQEKFEKLKSFVVHSDLLDIYNELMLLEEEQDIIDLIKNYEYIEELDRELLCQNLNSALQNFELVNFLYSPITDTILLWFNNNVNMNDIKNTFNIESHLETTIGFRDFYKYKLGGKTNLTEAVLRYDSLLNEVQTSKKRSISMDLKPITVYNLGSLDLQVFESHSNFFSPDSSYVKVKRVNYFDKLKSSVIVSIFKNDTLLTYECNPDNHKKYIMLRMSLCNTVDIGCSLSWNQHQMNNEDDVSVESKSFNSDISLNISLPTGLFIEIVRSDSILGPFYIRQRYLSKGPTCSNIWDENFRCYLKNGTIVIFYRNDTVVILYSNGTKVNCASFELINKYSEIAIVMDDEEKDKREKNIDKSKITKVSKSDQDLMKAKSKKGGLKKSVNKSTFKSPKSSVDGDKPQVIKANEAEKPTQKPLNISKHSVIAWNGSSTAYEYGVLKESSNLLTLRMAFDHINQELYLQRSDKLTLLYTIHDLTVTFPDGSKITSIMEDRTTLINLNELNEIAMEDKKSGSVSQNPSSERSSAEDCCFNVEPTGDKGECFVFVELSHFSEHKNYAAVNFDNLMNEVDLILPGGVVVKVDAQGLFTISGKGGEQIRLTNQSLSFEADVLENSTKRSKTFLYFENIDSTPTVQCQTEDSFGNLFSVDEYGRTNVLQVHWDFNRGGNSIFPRYPKNFERLFLFNRDLTGYEMIHRMQYNMLLSDKKTKIVKNCVKSDLGELFTLFAQTPIFKNLSQEYLLNYENNLPTLIRRKDLIRSSRMPDHIWFIPELSTVTEPDIEITISKYKIPEAFAVRKLFKIKEDGEKLLASFCGALKQYVALGEELYTKYFLAYPKETRSYEIYEQGEIQREEMFRSGSYYLSDNIKIPEVDNNEVFGK